MGNKPGKTKGLNKVYTSTEQSQQSPENQQNQPIIANDLDINNENTPDTTNNNSLDDPYVSRQGVKEMITPVF